MTDNKTCMLCGGQAGVLGSYKTSDGKRVCIDCFQVIDDARKKGFILPLYGEEMFDSEIAVIYEYLCNPNSRESKTFLASNSPCAKSAKEFAKYRRVGCVALNDENKTLFIATGMLPTGGLSFSQTISLSKKINGYDFQNENVKDTWISYRSKSYRYEDISDFELIEDDISLASGGLASAVVGGILFGGVGAVVGAATGTYKTKGACRSLRVKIGLLGESSGVEYIDLITMKTEKKEDVYTEALQRGHEILLGLQSACDYVKQHKENTQATVSATPLSEADEILKYKNLLDLGVITQDEFDIKKRQLLGIDEPLNRKTNKDTSMPQSLT